MALTIDPNARLCQNCGKRKIARPRRLCCPCYADKAVLEKYPPAKGSYSKEPATLEEVDALIARQRQNLPNWWARAEEEMREREAKGTNPMRCP